MRGRIEAVQISGNSPIEDTLAAAQLSSVQGYYLGIFDGHGGWQVSTLCKNKLHIYLDELLKGAKSEDQVKDAIRRAFAKLETEWVDFVSEGFTHGFAKTAYVGSCAIVAVVIDNKLYIANAGDSKAVLLKQTDDKFEAINVSTTFNANKKYEQERLKK